MKHTNSKTKRSLATTASNNIKSWENLMTDEYDDTDVSDD